jgi:diketogulonate reductase-like aldo/keto reductase
VLLEAAVHCFLGLDRNAPRNAHGEHGGKERADSRIAGGIFAGIQLILRDRYLLAIVAYLLLHSLASTFLYFEQGRLVASTLHDTATRTRLFAITDFAVSCITLLLQLFVTGRFLRRFGVVAALLLLPLASLFAYGAIALWPLLAVLVAAQSLRRALDYAVARPGREVLFTVVSREAKYKARNVIETVVFRGGDAATGWLFAGLAAAGIGFGAMAIASLPLVAGWSALALWLARAQERKAGLAMNGPPEETMPTAPGPRGSGDQQENAMSQTDRPHSPDLHEAGGMSRKDFLRLAVATVAGTTFGANAQSPAGSASASAAGGAVGGTVGGGAPAGKMHTRAIPSSGERLGIIGCGTWQTFDVGSTPAERDPLADVLRILFAAGGSVIDSSPMYGRSEAVAGDLLTALQLHERAFVATKVWTTGREAGIKQMHESMALLQQPRINLMQIHNLVDWRTHLKTLRAWKDEARIRYLGITHYTASAFDQLASILRTEKLDFVQMNYSLDDRDAEARLLPLAADRGVAVLVNQPFGGGSLLRKLARAPLPQWAGEIGCGSWAQILLKYVVSHPAVTCAIPGTGKPRHMTDNCRAGVGILPDAAMRKKMVATWQTL